MTMPERVLSCNTVINPFEMKMPERVLSCNTVINPLQMTMLERVLSCNTVINPLQMTMPERVLSCNTVIILTFLSLWRFLLHHHTNGVHRFPSCHEYLLVGRVESENVVGRVQRHHLLSGDGAHLPAGLPVSERRRDRGVLSVHVDVARALADHRVRQVRRAGRELALLLRRLHVTESVERPRVVQ